MAGSRKLKFRLPLLHGLALWVPITALLTLGLVTTIIDLSHLPLLEASSANENRQRFVINAATGEVSLGDTSPDTLVTPPSEFDVGTAEESTTLNEPVAAGEAPAEIVAPAENAAPTETPVVEAAAPLETASGETTPALETEAPAIEPTTAAPKVVEAEPLAKGTVALRTSPLPSASGIEMPAHTKDSLVSAPAPEITETLEGLRIPKRGAKDTTPASLYAHRFTRKPDQVIISFVVMNAGLDPQSIGLILGLPHEVTVAYSPYSRAESNYSEHLRASGHEVWTMLPVMTDRYPSDDPGPIGIIGRMPPEEIIRRTHHIMAAVLGSVGFILPPDEAISSQKGTLAPVLDEISARGLLLLSTHPTRSIDQLTTTKGMGDIIRRADLVLDASLSEAQIRSKLAGVLDAAKEKGEYIVLLSARPQSLQILSEWLKATNLTEPFALAPLSAFYLPKVAPEVKAPEEKGGHGGGEKKDKQSKPTPKKKPKVLPQDQYLKPAEGAKKEGGGH
ncbi:MAG: divergent polysaccharide deacetylase family protein [Rickettsiales bacterium]|nr:divergent polysaccharide deacetylase family protein [Rickettsiales bacterium]